MIYFLIPILNPGDFFYYIKNFHRKLYKIFTDYKTLNWLPNEIGAKYKDNDSG